MSDRDKIVLSGHGEEFDLQYGKLDYKDKVVLDIGCHIGDSTSYFLRRGAKEVVAVDKDITEISKNYTNSDFIKIVQCEIKCGYDLFFLITRYVPNIVKLDCEGAEKYLLDVDDIIIQIPKAYTMEIHKKCGVTPEQFKEFFEKNEFEVELIFDPKWQAEGTTSGLYARRKEL